ncbi:Gfo/Idh/MocA family oxidoreductase [Lyngbya sp. CCY1209]|uniref:Gfo/Idh/MocA family protein n=1 Tax=Lyngbya sp. CCY1209 TaxID=2886103 RepID=UPI002D1FFBE6|nr:Gfo/Idh/MocA family oxidoreductase [Lyngbya sp. CCY1209]MEB3884241.1 Gfo/Idh/MocA family oxidoreductase [Lyngbya sp. CCY1209]
MADPIKVAVLGAGRWGNHLIRNFQSHPDSEVVAVAEAIPEQLKIIGERYQLNEKLLFSDCSAALDVPGLQAVAIATPASTHYDLIVAALERGYHVFAEKPLTVNPAKSLELCELAKRQNRQLFVDHTYLFNSVVERGQEAIAQNAVGELRYGYATRTHLEPIRRDVDALWDLAIHDIAIFNSWLGQKPVAVQATGTVWLQPNRTLQTEDGSSPVFPATPGLSDLVMATLTYPDGFRAYIHLCWLNPDKQRRLAVVGSRGTLIFDELDSESPLTLLHGHLEAVGETWKGAGQRREVLEVPPAEPLKRACDRFLECVKTNQPCPTSSGKVGAELVKILWGLSASLQRGGETISL